MVLDYSLKKVYGSITRVNCIKTIQQNKGLTIVCDGEGGTPAKSISCPFLFSKSRVLKYDSPFVSPHIFGVVNRNSSNSRTINFLVIV